MKKFRVIYTLSASADFAYAVEIKLLFRWEKLKYFHINEREDGIFSKEKSLEKALEYLEKLRQINTVIKTIWVP